jgi:hypothetical protein
LLNQISDVDLIVWALLAVVALILAAAAYLDFGSLKSFRIEPEARRSREEYLARSRSKTF